MVKPVYVEDVIVPMIAVPKVEDGLFTFLGSGFFIGNEGYLLTCGHVSDSLGESERLCAYQLGKRRVMEVAIIKRSGKYDIALCKGNSPGIDKPWPFADESYMTTGDDIEVYGYIYEPLGPGELPFRQRYYKGYITGISREGNFPDSYELNFPILFGTSGSPLVYHLPIEGKAERLTVVAGLTYGSRESEVVHHTVTATDDFEERVSRIVELGLAYRSEAIFALLRETGLDLDIEILTS